VKLYVLSYESRRLSPFDKCEHLRDRLMGWTIAKAAPNNTRHTLGAPVNRLESCRAFLPALQSLPQRCHRPRSNPVGIPAVPRIRCARKRFQVVLSVAPPFECWLLDNTNVLHNGQFSPFIIIWKPVLGVRVNLSSWFLMVR